jgi:hypothetical protein
VGGVTLDSMVARSRRRQADLFRDEGTLSRLATTGSLNPTTGVWTPGATTVIYTGACLLRAFTWEGTDVQFGDIEVRLRRVRAKFPVDTDVQIDDVFVASASTYDESLVGISFRVTDAFRDGWQISRVCIMEEITS